MSETASYPVGAAVYCCPLPACEWTFSQLPPSVTFEEWAARAGVAGIEKMTAIAEQRIARHLITHTPSEWVAEISRLTAIIAKVTNELDVARAAAEAAAAVVPARSMRPTS